MCVCVCLFTFSCIFIPFIFVIIYIYIYIMMGKRQKTNKYITLILFFLCSYSNNFESWSTLEAKG